MKIELASVSTVPHFPKGEGQREGDLCGLVIHQRQRIKKIDSDVRTNIKGNNAAE